MSSVHSNFFTTLSSPPTTPAKTSVAKEIDLKDTESFPALGKSVMKTPVKEKSSEPVVPNAPKKSTQRSSKKTILPIEFVLPKNEGVLAADGKEIKTEENKSERSLRCTKPCRSVLPGASEKCPHGKSCSFAHSVNDLVAPACRFGEKCNLVNYTEETGLYSNIDGCKICTFIHPDEAITNYADRCDIKFKNYKPSSEVVASSRQAPTNPAPKRTFKAAPPAPWKKVPEEVKKSDEDVALEIALHESMIMSAFFDIPESQSAPLVGPINMPPPLQKAHNPTEIPTAHPVRTSPIKKSITPSTSSTSIPTPTPTSTPAPAPIPTPAPPKTTFAPSDEEMIIRVPRELAIQAMTIAMNSGKTNIRIEYV